MKFDAFSALGNRTRRKIVNQLRMGPKSVGQIAKSMKVSRPAVSQGLKVLRQVRLVKRISLGRQMFYKLDPQGLEEPRLFIEGLDYVIEMYGHKKPGE